VRHHVCSARGLRRFVFEGKTMSPLQAFESGFGDAFVIEPMLSASQWLRDRMSLPAGIFELTKRQVNAPFFVAIAHPSAVLRVTHSIESQRENIARVMSSALRATQGNGPRSVGAAQRNQAAHSANPEQAQKLQSRL